MPRPGSQAVLPVALAGLFCACGRSGLPDPREAAVAYARAAARGDSAAVYGLLSREGKRTLGREGTRRLMADARAELSTEGRRLLEPGAQVEAQATVLLSDGSEVGMSLEGDEFRVDAAATLPSAAHTPAQALDGLRRALERRSYSALMRVMSADSRGALESDVRSLLAGLEEPATLDVRINGDRADVEVPGGHAVSLRREGGVWRVEDVK